jgi:hypothetical protein
VSHLPGPAEGPFCVATVKTTSSFPGSSEIRRAANFRAAALPGDPSVATMIFMRAPVLSGLVRQGADASQFLLEQK